MSPEDSDIRTRVAVLTREVTDIKRLVLEMNGKLDDVRQLMASHQEQLRQNERDHQDIGSWQSRATQAFLGTLGAMVAAFLAHVFGRI